MILPLSSVTAPRHDRSLLPRWLQYHAKYRIHRPSGLAHSFQQATHAVYCPATGQFTEGEYASLTSDLYCYVCHASGRGSLEVLFRTKTDRSSEALRLP